MSTCGSEPETHVPLYGVCDASLWATRHELHEIPNRGQKILRTFLQRNATCSNITVLKLAVFWDIHCGKPEDSVILEYYVQRGRTASKCQYSQPYLPNCITRFVFHLKPMMMMMMPII